MHPGCLEMSTSAALAADGGALALSARQAANLALHSEGGTRSYGRA